jgi:hypothetical protein
MNNYPRFRYACNTILVIVGLMFAFCVLCVFVAGSQGKLTATSGEGSGPVSTVAPPETTTTVGEDNPDWDCRVMGDRRCGEGAPLAVSQIPAVVPCVPVWSVSLGSFACTVGGVWFEQDGRTGQWFALVDDGATIITLT